MIRPIFIGMLALVTVTYCTISDTVVRFIEPAAHFARITGERVLDFFWRYMPKDLPQGWIGAPLVSRMAALGRSLLFIEDKRAHIVRLGQHG